MRRLTLLASFALAACASGVRHGELARPTPVFALERFFDGATEGTGTLKVVFSEPRAISVHGHGETLPDGTLVLSQEVEQAGQNPTRREWRLHREGGGWSGTLSDATGPVHAEVTGNLLHIAFPSKDGRVEQWIYLQPGGMSALNRMAVTRMGVRVATIEETIRKEGD